MSQFIPLRKYLHRGTNWLIFYNFYIAFAAIAMANITIIQTGTELVQIGLMLLIFGATFLTYNADLNYPRNYTFSFGKIVAVLLVVLGFWQINTASRWFLLHLALLSSFYAQSSQLLGKLGRYPLRQIPFLKVFLIAYTWAGVTSILPHLQAGFSFDDTFIWGHFAARFCFIMGITIPFDIGDYQEDLQQGVRTLPQLIGIENSKGLSFIFLFTFGGVTILIQSVRIADWLIISLASYLIWQSSPERSRIYYKKYLDGLMLLYWVLICIESLLLY